GIFEFDAIFGAGVPDGVDGRKVAVAFDFGRAGVVEVTAPMSDVAMMADPIEQLPAAGVVVPTPMLVKTTLDVGHHFGGANPGIVIEFGRRLGHAHKGRRRVLRLAVTFGKADFDMGDFSDEAAADDFRGLAEVRKRTLPGTGLPDAFIF